MAQKVNALIFFAAIEIPLPSLSSLVASCKISESSAPQELRIKIQANIEPSLRRLPPSRQIFPHPYAGTQANFGQTATQFRRKTPKLDAGNVVPLTRTESPRVFSPCRPRSRKPRPKYSRR